MQEAFLDIGFNSELADFGHATIIGQFLEGALPPQAKPILAGPSKGTYGLCSARTEQFTVGTLLYFMVYGHEPYDDVVLSSVEWGRDFGTWGSQTFIVVKFFMPSGLTWRFTLSHSAGNIYMQENGRSFGGF
ncbi:hypothetical protein AJ78_02913 [Emergomyces pasteurianus Ep9510]|uniref:Protein kinase domain-containing protein n=1 Tax=Emergomyces pasteurianus Ep9510 TaxID=1447872 RepID=A0A1J9Q9Q7_9EURO|nr:hypothetical protein AJ78_02913 [Emergomyces pasteurianus Ep9510]